MRAQVGIWAIGSEIGIGILLEIVLATLCGVSHNALSC